jgi:hypothetical protein
MPGAPLKPYFGLKWDHHRFSCACLLAAWRKPVPAPDFQSGRQEAKEDVGLEEN